MNQSASKRRQLQSDMGSVTNLSNRNSSFAVNRDLSALERRLSQLDAVRRSGEVVEEAKGRRELKWKGSGEGRSAFDEEDCHIVTAPPGRLGLILNVNERGGALVHSVKDQSPLKGVIFKDDVIISIDGEDVTQKRDISEVTHILSSRSALSRKLKVFSEVV